MAYANCAQCHRMQLELPKASCYKHILLMLLQSIRTDVYQLLARIRQGPALVADFSVLLSQLLEVLQYSVDLQSVIAVVGTLVL